LFQFHAAFAAPPKTDTTVPAVRITLPDGTIVGSDQSDIHKVLSTAFKRPVRLDSAGHLHQAGATATPAHSAEEYWPDIEGLDYRDTVTEFGLPEGTFFDAAAVHILTTATLDRLRASYPQGRFEARRFRPNVVIEPANSEAAFVENSWIGRTLAIGDEVRLSITGPCPRCVMTTLAQGDLPQDAGILRTAAQHNHAHVGVYASVLHGGTIRRGDSVTVE
jgi:hypothetical protein